MYEAVLVAAALGAGASITHVIEGELIVRWRSRRLRRLQNSISPS